MKLFEFDHVGIPRIPLNTTSPNAHSKNKIVCYTSFDSLPPSIIEIKFTFSFLSVPFRLFHLCWRFATGGVRSWTSLELARGIRNSTPMVQTSRLCSVKRERLTAAKQPREGVVGSWWCTGWLTVAMVGVYTRYSPILIGASACHAGVRDAGRCVPLSRTCVNAVRILAIPQQTIRRSSMSPSVPWPCLFLEPSPKKRPSESWKENSFSWKIDRTARNLLDLRGKYIISLFYIFLSRLIFNYASWFYDCYVAIT